jgi:ribonuclease P protein component
MLPKNNRLKKKNNFDNLFRKGKGFKEGCLSLKAAKNRFKMSRFGFIVGKNFSKKASQRNKIKRKLREIIRLRLPQIKTGFDVALIVQKCLADKSNKETLEAVNKLLKRAKLIQ